MKKTLTPNFSLFCYVKISILFCSLFLTFENAFSQIQLWGMTAAGGDSYGTIFKTDADGSNLQVKGTFSPNAPGGHPYYLQLCEATNGKLYGMTYGGGLNGEGIIFEYDNSSTAYTKKIDFAAATGSYPKGSLIQASNGKLYGMTSSGGVNNVGVIFEYDYSTNTYTKKIDLSSANGSAPEGSLMEASNGKLYGMTYQGGANSLGVIFEYDFGTNTYTKKIDLSTVNGSAARGSLIEATTGKLYGMTQTGGANGMGTLFEYDYVSNTYTKKIDCSSTNGSYPQGSLMKASNSKLYGVTYMGGTNGVGTVFEYDYATNTYTKKVNLTIAGGYYSFSSLIQASNSKLYGMSYQGGINDMGVVFEYDYSTNTYIKKIDFNLDENGFNPYGSFMQASNGKIYGMTYEDVPNYAGVLFEYDYTSNTYTKKISLGSPNGAAPYGSFIKATNGKLYGTTTLGGSGDFGVIFEYDYSNDTYTKKSDLIDTDGGDPQGDLLQASNGKFYGMGFGGGANGTGVIFEYDNSNNSYTKLSDLILASGVNPEGSFVEAPNGKLYGMMESGGANSGGVIFEYDIASNISTIKVALSTANGKTPIGSLLLASNGKFYGMTALGGVNNKGVIFEYDYATDTYTKKIDLSTANGSTPEGSLIEALNGKLYGLTNTGGTNNAGVIFEYDYATNTYTKKIDLSSAGGSRPRGSLMQSSNGKLYGMTNQGGTNNTGVLFEYDYATNTYTKKQDFTGANGMHPVHSALLEICATPIPTGSGSQFFCTSSSVSVSDLAATGTNIKWYDAPEGGNLLASSANLVSGNHYYASQTDLGCESSMRLDVVATINSLDITTSKVGTTITANMSSATYKWLDCNNSNAIIPNETGQNFSAVVNGDYAVVVSESGCSDTSACVNITVNSISNNAIKRNYHIYPNPAVGALTISSENLEGDELSIAISDIQGKEVYRYLDKNISKNYYRQINVSSLSKGIYYIRLNNGREAAVEKLVIE